MDEGMVSKDLEQTPPVLSRRAFRSWLVIILLARTGINVPIRIIYPFLPAIARGLGVSLAVAGGLVGLRVIGGVGAPFLGYLADRYGRRRMMETALLFLMFASLLLAGYGSFATAAVAFTLYGIAKALYDPAMQAYLGEVVPYQKRGRVIGMVEFSWAGAWLLGVPAAGFLIDRWGWRAPWVLLILLGGIGLGLTRVGLPVARHHSARDSARSFFSSMVVVWRDLFRRRPVRYLLATGFLITIALEVPFIVYGAWLETTFELSLTTLGLASIVIGLSEITAEFGTTMVTDRLGKWRSVRLGLLGLGSSLVLLPWLSQFGLVTALIGLACPMLAFEFGFVSLLPLATELAPEARSSLISLNVAAFNLARIAGTFVGGWLWRWEDIALNAGVGAVCAFMGLFLLVRWHKRNIGEEGVAYA